MTDIGELVVRIKADVTQLQSELAKATGTVKQSSSRMEEALRGVKEQFKELLPAISLVALEEFTRRSVESGIEMAHMSERTGIAIETLSGLEVVVRQNGASLQDLAAGIKFMNRNISEAAENASGPAAKALK